MSRWTFWLGFTSLSPSAYCPCCGGPAELRSPLEVFAIAGDAPRVVCVECGRRWAPTLAGILDAVYTVDPPDHPARAAMVRSCSRHPGLVLLAECASEPEEVTVSDEEWVPADETAGEARARRLIGAAKGEHDDDE